MNGIEIGGKRVNTCTIEEAFDPEAGGAQYPLACSSNDPEFIKLRANPPEVRQAGEKLYGALIAHQAGRDFFAQAMAVPAPAPLYIQVDAPDAEDLPWEILWEMQKSFMALDPAGRWPIARLASARKRSEPLDRIIGSELRIAVVLAAARENGADEWGSISAAIDGFNTPVDLLGIVSEEATKTAMAASATSWHGHVPTRNLEVDFVADSTSLIARLQAHVPNVIHFFCHGIADVRPQLELENRADRRGGKDRGSITLGIELLRELAALKSLWLVVLNCCQGAKAVPQLHSLARDLVARGVPAVVAMRESVDVNDANFFAEHFYPTLFAQLQGTFALRNNPAIPKPLLFPELVWVRAVDEARRQLSFVSGPPDSSVEWTYPVVYVHRDVLRLHPRELKAAALSAAQRLELVTQLELLRAVRSTLEFANDTGEAAQRTKLDTDIQQIEAQLAAG